MKIALDYDETFTEDPIFWRGVIDLAKQRGHSVTFVTFRVEMNEGYSGSHNADICADAADLNIDVIFTNGQQKAHHFDADVWIDDMPEIIPHAKTLLGMYNGCVNSGDVDDATK